MVHMAVAAVHTHSQELTDLFHGRLPTNDEKIIVRAQEKVCHRIDHDKSPNISPSVFGLLLCLIVYALFILNIIDMMGEDLCQMLNMLCY